jgi:hypothetical protein
MSRGFQVIKNISDEAYTHFDFPTVGENIYRSGTATSQPLAEEERKMCRSVIAETGLTQRRMGKAHVEENRRVN